MREEFEAAASMERLAMPATWDWPLQSPLKLNINAVRCNRTPAPTSPLPAEPVANQSAHERITLIPYGCTKFRISMFPLTARAWKVFETQ